MPSMPMDLTLSCIQFRCLLSETRRLSCIVENYVLTVDWKARGVLKRAKPSSAMELIESNGPMGPSSIQSVSMVRDYFLGYKVSLFLSTLLTVRKLAILLPGSTMFTRLYGNRSVGDISLSLNVNLSFKALILFSSSTTTAMPGLLSGFLSYI